MVLNISSIIYNNYLMINYIKNIGLQVRQEIQKQYKQIKSEYVPVNYKSNKQSKQAKQFRNTIYITLINPFKIQYYFWLWLIYAFYATIKMIVIIPFQLIIGSLNSFLSIIGICRSKYTVFFSVMIVIVCWLFLSKEYILLDPSFMYHVFRGQSTIKLYTLIFAIEVTQKISTLVGKYLYINIKKQLQNPSIHGIFLLPEMLACIIYTIVHTYFIFLQFNIYMVIINGPIDKFLIFCFVTNLSKMKTAILKKFDLKAYLSVINYDAKDRFQKSLYLVLFFLAQWERQIPDIKFKLIFVFIVGAIIEHIKHITVLMRCGQMSQIDNIRNTMFKKMYVSTDDHTFVKCLNTDFTVIPFSVFIIKMIGVSVDVKYSINNEIVLLSYLGFIFLFIIIKILMFIIRKINLLNCPTTQEVTSRVTSMKEIGREGEEIIGSKLTLRKQTSLGNISIDDNICRSFL